MRFPRSPHFGRLLVFAAVAEAGGFTAAAQRLGMSKTLVSQHVGKLESELGGALFTRTTRRVTLTDAGERLLAECAPLLRDLSAAVERFQQASAGPSGTLRVTAPPEYAANVLGALLAEFGRIHPALAIDLVSTGQVLDLVAERVDVAIRMGWLRDSSLRATQLGEFGQCVVASPEYLARAGAPSKPEDLADHPWIALSLLRAPLSWRFTREGRARRVVDVRVRAGARGNAPDAVLGLARGGAGITVLADFAVAGDLAAGRLVRVLEAWSLPRGGIYAVYPASAAVPVRARAFIDFLRERWVAGRDREAR